MAIVSTDFPDRIGLFHNRDGGTADWNVLVEDFEVEVEVDSSQPISYGDQAFIRLEVDGTATTVGDINTDNDFYFDWYTGNQQGTFTLRGRRDDDSSRIVAQHDATQYSGLPPGEGEWVLEYIGFSDRAILHREPVTVYPKWVNPNVLSLQDCSATATDLRPGDQTTISTTIDNPGYDPLAGEAVAFVGGAEEAIPFEVSPRGNTSVEATFEANENGTLEYGFDLENVAHNY